MVVGVRPSLDVRRIPSQSPRPFPNFKTETLILSRHFPLSPRPPPLAPLFARPFIGPPPFSCKNHSSSLSRSLALYISSPQSSRPSTFGSPHKGPLTSSPSQSCCCCSLPPQCHEASPSSSWKNVTRSGSTVMAIGLSGDCVFVSFESGRRNSNAIVVYDLHSFRPVSEIAHNEIFGADLDSAIPATKLSWIPSYGLLMASGSHGGPSGVMGNIRLWDVRLGNPVWEIKDTIDCFADVSVSDNLSAMFKVEVNSGEVFFVDLRLVAGDGESWNCLGDARKSSNSKREGAGCKIESHGNYVFCTKEEIELVVEKRVERCDGGSRRAAEDVSAVFLSGGQESVRDLTWQHHLGGTLGDVTVDAATFCINGIKVAEVGELVVNGGAVAMGLRLGEEDRVWEGVREVRGSMKLGRNPPIVITE